MLAGKGLASAEVSQGWDLVNAFPLSKTLSFSVLAQDGASTGVAFSPDGLSMYIVGTGTDTVYQYTLSTAWDITTASYASKSFSVVSQETGPQDLFFKPDGLTMYVLGNASDAVYQYTLSTAWDISTASYASKSFSVASQDGGSTGLFFKPDGLAMYIVGTGSDTVYQYTLGTAWDVSTASYASKSFSVAGQDTVFAGLFFKSDGTVMYVAGNTSSAPVFQYSLGTAWDVSTATYRARSSTLITGDAPNGMFIKGDGGILYIVNNGADTVTQYPINDPWNIASASYTAREFYTTAQQATGLTGMFMSPDGTTMYVANITSDIVYQYTLATAWQINTASYTGKSFSVSSQETNPYGIFFKSDGLAMYIVGRTADAVFQYTLSTAWDVSTASYASKSFSVAGQEANTNGLFFKPDGTAMYIVGVTSDTVFQYTLSTAWDVSTASYASKSFSVAAQDTAPQTLFFKPDGAVMYMVGSASDTVFQYTLGTAWDVSTASYASILLSVSAQDTVPTGLFIDSAGTSLYVAGNTNNRVSQFTLPTAWSLVAGWTTKVGLGPYYRSALVTSRAITPTDVFLSSDSTTMYVADNNTDTVVQYTLTTPGDIGTAFYPLKSFVVSGQDSTLTGLFFKPDGTAMYIVGSATNRVYQYTLSTAWDVATASYASKSFSVSGQENNPSGLFFKPDGTAMYVVGSTADTVFQYTLSTAWDVSTASYASKSFLVSGQDTSPTGLFFKSDGTAMYVLGSTSNSVYQYNLSTAWDVSTASYASISVSVVMFETASSGLCFNTAGTRMYIVGQTSDTVFQFNTE
jgi:sugar lactone lactonase YvrE